MKRHLAATILLAFATFLSSVPARAEETTPPAQSQPRMSRSATPAPGEKKLPWLAFDAATVKAKKENKHIIVDVYTTWCGWCKVMDRTTYGNSEVADYLLSNFVLAKVNGEASAQLHWKGKAMSERQFARAVGVTGYPATYFLKPDAEIIGGTPGFIRPDDFLIYAKYVHTMYYEKGSPQDYLKSLEQDTPKE
jgi:thioredoxin-related protein